ncbi:M4 family metallopeptidase [Bacillus sp. AFS041924]|uniref:M4 family metallopeptidase n=1 Tax=Bacillus sp. AFS041924 TaxID=2033503 RepID=UPI0020D26EB7|nr:M4 family metallopeptidase [Bacillus sp. AFS041924]
MKKRNSKSTRSKTVIPAVLSLSVAMGGLIPATIVGSGKASAQTVSDVVNKDEIIKAFLHSKVENQKTRLVNIGEQFKIVSEETDPLTGTYHVRTVEQYKGIPIYGSGQTVALDANNNVYSSIGKVTQDLSRSLITTEATISEEDAVEIAKDKVESKIGTVERYDQIDSQLTIYPFNGKYYLTYLVKASTSTPAPGFFHYFVDANSGEVIDSYNALDTAIDPTTLSPVTGRGLDLHGKMQSFPVGKDLATGTSYLYGASVYGTNSVPIATFTAKRANETAFQIVSAFGFSGYDITTNSSSNFFADPAAISAQFNSDKVNQYYQHIHKRNSLDNNGMKLINTVHVGVKWNNAGWNGKQMVYGDGDGVKYSSLAGGLDVAGHEMTHGVVTNSADLIYKNESGAIDESLADILGNFAQIYTTGTTEWELGEEIFTPNINGDGGLRSMSNPAGKAQSLMPSGHYPDTYQDRYLGTEDNGGVHINSGINNKAAYLLTQGGTNNGITIKGIGNKKAEKIYYRALTLYLTQSSGFKEMREAAIQAARDLYDKNGVTSAETQAVMDAYTSVGVY